MTIALPLDLPLRSGTGRVAVAGTSPDSAVSDHIDGLGSHVRACARARGPCFSLKCLAERVDAVIAPRFCTTVLLAGLLIGVGSVWG